jgi:acyl-CoA reductase-like NAD-dependent aldehyde dehydrogenase
LKFKTINPATEGIINEYENMTYEHLDNILTTAKKAFVRWKEDFKSRADYLYAFLMNLGRIRRI